MSDIGNSNRISREYIDSLRIETRYMDSTTPDTAFTLYGERFPSPIMTAALSHLDHFMFPGAATALAQGAKAANAVLWYGMADDAEIDALAATGARMIEIIKPYTDRDKLLSKLRHAEALGLLAVGVDIDHPGHRLHPLRRALRRPHYDRRPVPSGPLHVPRGGRRAGRGCEGRRRRAVVRHGRRS